MQGDPWIEWRSISAIPVTVGERTVTPVARSLVVRWPGGGATWSGPASVLVERDGTTERIPITHVNAWILGAIRVGAIAAIAAATLWDRRRRDSDD